MTFEDAIVPCALVVTGAVTTWAGMHIGTKYLPRFLDEVERRAPPVRAERTEQLREDKSFKWPQLPKGKPRAAPECVINIEAEDALDEAIQEHEAAPTQVYAPARCCICNRLGSPKPAKNGKHYCKACRPKEE